jgi:hypothetical protein
MRSAFEKIIDQEDHVTNVNHPITVGITPLEGFGRMSFFVEITDKEDDVTHIDLTVTVYSTSSIASHRAGDGKTVGKVVSWNIGHCIRARKC